MTDLAGSLVTSCRPPGRLQKRPDNRTWNTGVAVRTADGSRRTADNNNNNNNNSHDNVYDAVIMTKVIARVHPVHLMNVD